MIYYKEGVNIRGIAPELLVGLKVAEDVYKGRALPMWVTSINDGVHMEGSFHYLGKAADLRTRGTGLARQLYNDLRKVLKPLGFDILLEHEEMEAEHIHLEYDPD